MTSEQWCYCSNAAPLIAALNVSWELETNQGNDLQRLFDHFSICPLLPHKAQSSSSYTPQNAYIAEKSFKRAVSAVSCSSVSLDANMISSDVVYRVNVYDNDLLDLKARTGLDWNEGNISYKPRHDWSICTPGSVRILISTAFSLGWRLTKADFKRAFLPTGVVSVNHMKSRYTSLPVDINFYRFSKLSSTGW